MIGSDLELRRRGKEIKEIRDRLDNAQKNRNEITSLATLADEKRSQVQGKDEKMAFLGSEVDRLREDGKEQKAHGDQLYETIEGYEAHEHGHEEATESGEASEIPPCDEPSESEFPGERLTR